MRAILSLGLVIAVMLALSPGLVSQSEIFQPASHPRLRLHRGVFDARATPQAAPEAPLAVPAPGPYSIIQLRGPVTIADREALERTGLELLEYLPDYAYLVRGSDAQLREASRLPQTYARTAFTLADKLAPALLRAVARGDVHMGLVRVLGWPDDDGDLARDLEKMGLEGTIIADRATLLQLAGLPSVRWIEPVTRPHLVNDVAREIMNVEPVWQNRGLYGAGQVVAITDSGLDTGDEATISPDFAGRILATHVLSTGAHWDDNNGHGTHVAGSVAGAGVQSGANPAAHDYTDSFAGAAPEANLVIQAFEATLEGEIIGGLDPDYSLLFDQAYADGARLHSDSWGDYTGPISDTQAAFGGYPFGARQTDQFLWENPDMAIFVAAGNAGKDGTPISPGIDICIDGDGTINPDSLLSPGTAKNVITVGASESQRSEGGLSTSPWMLLGFCFIAEPIRLDLTSNDPNGMAAFSSRGPADDGRVKPDIVAPGTNIISNRTHVFGASTLWGAYDADYVYSGGTSMATPLVAGSGALVREWLVDRGLANPSGAAIKAVMLNTTYDMAPGQYGIGPTQEITYTRPNTVAGWGRTDLGFMVAAAPYRLWVHDHTAGLDTDQVVTYTHSVLRPLQVLTDTQPLRVMLSWTDYPASLSAAAQLVNDLDLVVTGPQGLIEYGNDVDSGDRTNNVEGVIINSPPLGAYQIYVRAHHVPMFSQPYALAVGGPLGLEAALSADKAPSASSADIGQTITYTYRVANMGTVTLTGVTGADDRLGPVTFDSTTLGLNQVATGTLTYTLKVSNFPGPLTNSLSVSATSTVGQPIVAAATALAEVQVTNPAAITVTKTANVDMVEVGQTITYTYRVTNTGAVDFIDVVGADDALGPVTFIPATLASQKGATGTLTYTVRVADWPGTLQNTVAVSGTAWVGEPLTATAKSMAEVLVVNPAAITVTKDVNVDTAEVWQTITYTYRVTNTGAVDFIELTGTDDALGPVAFTPTALSPQQSATGTLTYTVVVTDWPGPIKNTVAASGTAWVGEPLTATASATATVALSGPVDLTVVKTASIITAEVGQTITYTYWVTNSGLGALVGVVARDDKLGFVGLDSTTLAPHAVASGTLTHTVQVRDLPGPLTNTVTASGTAAVGPPLLARATDWALVQLKPGVNNYLPIIFKSAP